MSHIKINFQFFCTLITSFGEWVIRLSFGCVRRRQPAAGLGRLGHANTETIVFLPPRPGEGKRGGNDTSPPALASAEQPNSFACPANPLQCLLVHFHNESRDGKFSSIDVKCNFCMDWFKVCPECIGQRCKHVKRRARNFDSL